MKLKKILLIMLGVSALFLAACGGEANPTPTVNPTDPSSGQTEPVATTNVLTGIVANGKIRVDILNDNLGVRFAYGNAAVVSSQEMVYNAATKLSASGTATTAINFVVVIQKETGYSLVLNPGIEADSLEEYLSDVMTLNAEGAKCVYVAISSGEVNWTKNLNTELDAAINRRKNAA